MARSYSVKRSSRKVSIGKSTKGGTSSRLAKIAPTTWQQRRAFKRSGMVARGIKNVGGGSTVRVSTPPGYNRSSAKYRTKYRYPGY